MRWRNWWNRLSRNERLTIAGLILTTISVIVAIIALFPLSQDSVPVWEAELDTPARQRELYDFLDAHKQQRVRFNTTINWQWLANFDEIYKRRQRGRYDDRSLVEAGGVRVLQFKGEPHRPPEIKRTSDLCDNVRLDIQPATPDVEKQFNEIGATQLEIHGYFRVDFLNARMGYCWAVLKPLRGPRSVTLPSVLIVLRPGGGRRSGDRR